MKEKGFTLIELLAVIVVLAIISLIATPIVMNTIEKSKKGAAERSAENYVNAVDTAIMEEKTENSSIADGEYTIGEDGNLYNGTTKVLDVSVNGTKPDTGSKIVIQNGSVVSRAIIDRTLKTTSIGYNSGKYTVTINDSGKATAIDTPATKEVYAWYTDTKNIGDTLTEYTTDASTLGKNYYLKHVLDSDDKIISSFACTKFNGTTERCLEGGSADTYGWDTDKSHSTGRVAKLYAIEQEGISGVSCNFDTLDSNCADGSVNLFADSSGYVGASAYGGYCHVFYDGSSRCASS